MKSLTPGNALAAQIEEYLLRTGGWVKAAELCRVFGVDQRELRATDGVPGLCTKFAISGNLGYRHFQCAEDDEFAKFYSRGRRCGIGQLVRLRKMRRRRSALLAPAPPAMTRDGQFVFFENEPRRREGRGDLTIEGTEKTELCTSAGGAL